LATTILHGKTTIELQEVMSAILLNEKMKKKLESLGQTFVTKDKGRKLERNTSKWHNKSKGRSKSRGSNC